MKLKGFAFIYKVGILVYLFLFYVDFYGTHSKDTTKKRPGPFA